ncbi:MAG: hypothetical protein WKG01_12415 [Kofleriaceae bacterium]
MAPERQHVVFVCEHGAAKSVIAAAYFNQAAHERGLTIRATARGADPQREPSTKTIAGLAADGLTPTLEVPHALTRSDLHDATRVIVFDCEQPTMVALRGLDTCWNDTPAIGEGYAGARDAIRSHILGLVDQMARDPRR